MRTTAMVLLAGLMSIVTACRPSDVLDVPPPIGEFAYSGLQGQATATATFVGAEGQFFSYFSGAGRSFQSGNTGLALLGGLLSDEYGWTWASEYQYGGNFDARITETTSGTNFHESGDGALEGMMQARQSLLLATGILGEYEPTSMQWKVGEAYALAGYAELLLAETYCAGVTLSDVTADGGWSYGQSLTTDSLLGTALGHFDSALAHAGESDTVNMLARIGAARALLDRSDYDSAARIVNGVPVGFVFNAELSPTAQTGVADYIDGDFLWLNRRCSLINTRNREGGNGLDFVSAADPRLIEDSMLLPTCDKRQSHLSDSITYVPLKFGNPPTGLVPLATGIEAQLIVAEGALHDKNYTLWLTTLNMLRNGGSTCATNPTCPIGTAQVPAQTTGLVSLSDPGTDSLRVATQFRERAFWLFGTGTRLGDMRRLIRNYGWSANGVFPTGTFDQGLVPTIPQYGNDVAVTLPTPLSGITIANPYYKGCTTPTTQA